MDIKTAIKKMREKGSRKTVQYLMRKLDRIHVENGGESKYINILLLTNRDSDNVGDQVIEACDISLIETVAENLKEKCYIESRAASIVSKNYLRTRKRELLKKAESLIANSDLIIFGGAPMFNYLYQDFYERTAVTLELAQKYHKPVLFSAIGIEGYDEENAKCQRLKKTLNYDCVKQITTRDDFDSLLKYKVNESIKVDKVSDPAVFSSAIFDRYKANKERNKKIGIFILRQNGFVDNKIDFPREDAAALWVSLADRLKQSGYDYEFLTSGHFADEAFIDYLIRECGISQNKCVFNMNSPEKLLEKISSCDAVVSCRLHPSIISYALDVPSLGLIWNPKVKGFYDSIGYGDRAIEVNREITADRILDKIKQIITEGIQKDEEFLTSVYRSLFFGVRNALHLTKSPDSPYSYGELFEKLPPYNIVPAKEEEERLQRKFRRTYQMYNKRFDKIMYLQERVQLLESENAKLKSETG